ncbi:hypothetical protein JXB12_07040 [candidate division KSB1 bacterium]|nr:hypothetical protein [candidate division KSB1 bacterium]
MKKGTKVVIKTKYRIIYFTVLTLLVSGISCDFDPGLEPINSNIEGTITYSGEWPGTPAEVRLVAATSFPPSGLSDLIIGESIPINGSNYDYKFYLKPGAYNVLGVAWREQGSSWDILSICGLYFEGTDSLSPASVILPDESSTVRGIDIHVDRSNAKRITDSRITGMIKFTGAWPDSITEVRVISTTQFSLVPTVKLPSLLDISFSNSIPVESDSAEYVINAYPGTFVATGVLFFRANQTLSLTDILYSYTVGGLSLTQIVVQENQTINGPNFNINFK